MKTKKLYLETYGCQMNFSDSEIVVSILEKEGYEITTDPSEADLMLVNTCSIRDNAEQRVWNRLRELKSFRKKNPALRIGVLGCMAERLKQQLMEEEKAVDLIAGPDAYRDLPDLIADAGDGRKTANVLLSAEETYAEISPVRYDSNGVSAFISIMRGCENFCAYCVVPFTRGKERSREPETIVKEAQDLFEQGYREVTLLGQNVNSYRWLQENVVPVDFPALLAKVAMVSPLLRVRFATSHPKDLSDELLHTMARHPNICDSIHLPVQSGSSRILKLMNRKYTREWYMDRILAIKKILPGCGLSTDIITGFCSETEDDHRETLSMMEWAGYDYAFMFKYSERPGTLAAKKLSDDVSDDIKSRRLQEIIDLQQKLSHKSNQRDIGNIFEVLVEGFSRKSNDYLSGRNSQNKVIVFPANGAKPGNYQQVRVTDCTSATLIGETVKSNV
ncbi:MAG: tRNA (N6-isopentenyl adenosine(37)-C2)-methylthiotransferase MiaB [Bacteroidetes bacterium]|nr:tRNA (N6-isopentenyl adenosine(37)-C2)-methylthiotransferase MiaB [Bacteroidota bacterium]